MSKLTQLDFEFSPFAEQPRIRQAPETPRKTPVQLQADIDRIMASSPLSPRGRSRYEEKQDARRARLERGAERARQERDSAFSAARRSVDGIPPGQPILVGHHSERRHRAALNRHDHSMRKAIAADEQSRALAGRAAAVGTAGISSDDPDAAAKLRAKLATLQRKQTQWKGINAAIRKHAKSGPQAQIGALMAIGLPESAARGLLEKDFAGRIGIPAYQLTNNNKEMGRLEERIKQLETRAAAAARESVTGEVQGTRYELIENREANRVQILFAGKPGAEVRSALKAAGFRWAPSEGAWQRQLSNQAWYQAQRVLGVGVP